MGDVDSHHALSCMPWPFELGETMLGEDDNKDSPNRGRGGRGGCSDLAAGLRNRLLRRQVLHSRWLHYIVAMPALAHNFQGLPISRRHQQNQMSLSSWISFEREEAADGRSCLDKNLEYSLVTSPFTLRSNKQ